jgi:Protein of unknown function (DUF4231)
MDRRLAREDDLLDPKVLENLSAQSSWYGARSQRNRSIYIRLKGIQIIFAAAVPVVAVAAPGNIQRWTVAVLGALIGIVEGFVQLGQYQQNWLLYRATRESLKREEFLHGAGAGPYAGIPDPDTVYIERCDAIMSGEHAKWLTTQEQMVSQKQDGSLGK